VTFPLLFADECCPAPLVRELRGLGFDIVYVIEGAIGLNDLSHARTAFDLGRVLISADYDFGELAIRHAEPSVGLLLLAPNLRLQIPASASPVAKRIAELADSLPGQLTNLEADGVRQRRLSQT
jgi:predicted nuclease of predicted toxin-antitoxin system